MIAMKQLWDCICMVTTQIDQWTTTLWDDITTEAMEDQSRQFVKECRALPKHARDSNAAKKLDSTVKNFLASLPLVSDLHHPSMRPRHWDALKEATQVYDYGLYSHGLYSYGLYSNGLYSYGQGSGMRSRRRHRCSSLSTADFKLYGHIYAITI